MQVTVYVAWRIENGMPKPEDKQTVWWPCRRCNEGGRSPTELSLDWFICSDCDAVNIVHTVQRGESSSQESDSDTEWRWLEQALRPCTALEVKGVWTCTAWRQSHHALHQSKKCGDRIKSDRALVKKGLSKCTYCGRLAIHPTVTTIEYDIMKMIQRDVSPVVGAFICLPKKYSAGKVTSRFHEFEC